MAEFHGLAAQVSLVLAIGLGAWAVLLALTKRPLTPMLVGGLVWLVLLLVVTGLLGATSALAQTPPSDPLHIVYGLLAASVFPGAWAIARSQGQPRRTVIVLAVASVVELILVFRLFQTGG
ncbi:MAG: hypothetical protein OEV61_03050 [Chloroflexota bacterium]|jgi:hypothetical protein|nr:hypothetical protein [Chloroflexota bacterium]MDH5243493.1 hypothetical protein [Chloroflexota bacterium]